MCKKYLYMSFYSHIESGFQIVILAKSSSAINAKSTNRDSPTNPFTRRLVFLTLAYFNSGRQPSAGGAGSLRDPSSDFIMISVLSSSYAINKCLVLFRYHLSVIMIIISQARCSVWNVDFFLIL